MRKYPDTLVGCAIRAAVFDGWIQEFLRSNNEVAVTLIGEGLDTTTDRNDDGKAHFFELDFPDVIELRRQFFEPTERRTFIAGSVFDTDWIDQVKKWDERFVVTDVEYMMNHHRHQWSGLARFWSSFFMPLRHGYQLNRATLGKPSSN